MCGGPEAAAVRVGSACAREPQPPPAPGAARPGPARLPQVSLQPLPGPSLGPRPIPRPANGALPEGSRPPDRTPTAPPGLPSDALRRPILILNSYLAAADFRSPARESAPRRAGRRLCSPLPVGSPERPFPPLFPKSGATSRPHLLGAEPGLRRVLAPGWAHLIPRPQRPAQRPANAPSQAQASPSRGDSVSIRGEGEAQRKP